MTQADYAYFLNELRIHYDPKDDTATVLKIQRIVKSIVE